LTVWLAVVRPLLSTVVLVLVYYGLPGQPLSGRGFLVLFGGLGLVAAVTVWQIRAVLRSPFPLWQGIEALAIVIPLLVLVFANACYLLSSGFSESLSRTDALYFAVTVFATVGFGDIVPVAPAARVLVTVQMVTNLVVLGLVLRIIVTAVQRSRGVSGPR
jgi:voltage-gated potassium channel